MLVYGLQNDELVKEMLVRQKNKAAIILGRLVAVLTICWLPHIILHLMIAYDSKKFGANSRTVTLLSWLPLTNSAINPFLYGRQKVKSFNTLRSWVKRKCQRRQYNAVTWIGDEIC